MNLKEKAAIIKKNTAALSIALTKKETPWTAKIVAAFCVVYALSPIDLIPDFIPVLGYLDDVLLLPGLILLCIKLIPEDLFRECQKEAEGLWENGKPEKWIYALPILALWGLVIYGIVKALR